MVTLPPAPWRDRPGLARLTRALGAGQTRLVGGAVRDTLLGIETSDVDLATVHSPETVIDLLELARIKAVPTGIAHGTITAVVDDEVYEVTTLRRDVATDGRHATVAFTGDWREDAARRDFTINALYADPATGELFDYFGGLDDLERGRVRFIGDPLTRIAEDHLRILRFFRFLARFGSDADADGLAACTTRANDLMALSRERIRDELFKLLIARDAVPVVALMIDRGIFRPVLPEITDADRLTTLARRETAAQLPADALRHLVALLPASSVEDVGARLKLSNLERKRIVLAAQPAGDTPADELVYRIGREGAVDRLLLSDRPIADVQAAMEAPDRRLPITGGTLVERGLSKGPDVARVLRLIEDRWIAEGFPDGTRIGTIADEEVAQALRVASKA